MRLRYELPRVTSRAISRLQHPCDVRDEVLEELRSLETRSAVFTRFSCGLGLAASNSHKRSLSGEILDQLGSSL